MRYFALATALALFPTSASASADARYMMRGSSHVHTTKAPLNVDKTYNTTMRAHIVGDEDAQVELVSDGMKCTLKGKRAGTTIALAPGQKCKQHVNDDGVNGDLLGTLVRGALTINGDKIALSAYWTFDGTVKFLFSHADVKGTIESNLKGTRS